MGRPKKMESDEMVRIVDLYFTTEAAGNPSLLMFSKFEKFAQSKGYDVKAYDFKRDSKVRARICELKEIVKAEGSLFGDGSLGYKGLDVSGILSQSNTDKELSAALERMDQQWKKTHDFAVSVKKKSDAISRQNRKCTVEIENLQQQIAAYEAQIKDLKKEINEYVEENRYLRMLFRKYLYPAISNGLLANEHIIAEVEKRLPDRTMFHFTEDTATIPPSVKEETGQDRELMSRSRSVLKIMAQSVEE